MTVAGRSDEPRWAGEVAALWVSELRSFASTVVRFARHPRRFGARWSTGQTAAMNPLGFLATSWPLLLPIDYGLQRLLGWDRQPNVPLSIEVTRALRPYLFVIPLSLFLHAVFRIAGSRRRFTTTLGALLYWVAFAAAGWIVGLAGCLVLGVDMWLPNLTGYLTMIWGGLVMAGVHGFHWGWCLLAFTVGFPVALQCVNVPLKLLGWL